MKTQLTLAGATLMLGLTLLTATPAEAAWYAKFDGVQGECAQAQDAMLEIKGQMPEPVALLVPAVQKVRDAAARMADGCTDRDGATDEQCASSTLAATILESDPEDELSLLGLYMTGTGAHYKEAILTMRKSGGDGGQGVEDMLTGILIGLLREAEAMGMPDSVTDQLEEAAAAARRTYEPIVFRKRL